MRMKLGAMVATTAGLAFAQAAHAQPPAADPAAEEGEAGVAEAAAEDRGTITVTGRRGEDSVVPDRPARSIYGFETSALDTPRSISQVTAEQLATDVLRSTDDFVKYAPGITRGGGQGNNAAPSIRAIAAEVFQNGQRIYKDGNDHPLNLNAFEGADIVAGPSSVIFGPSSGTGGYVNYLTKKPYFDRQRTQVTAGIGTWVPGDSSYSDFNLTLDTGGPISEQLAYRVSIKGQRGGTYYANVENNFNSFYGALSWRPSPSVRVDWNGSYDDYYDFNITRGWNRPTQALVDSFGKQYYAGRATPLINTPGVGIWSPVFGSGDPNAAPVGWQLRTRNANAQYIAGATQTTPLPNATAAGAGSVVGWVYDPSIPGNGLQEISASTGSGRPEDKNQAKRYISQLQVGVDLSDRWNLLWSGYVQRSINDNDSVGAFIYQNRSTLIDSRIEARGKIEANFFGLRAELQSNSGFSLRRLKYRALSANNNFNYNPFDLTLDPSTLTPAALYGLAQADPNSSGSWIGTPGLPQLTSFGYINFPRMVPVNDGFYAEIGGSPPGGAVYTSNGHINQWSFFTQQNLRFGDVAGINVGVNVTQIEAYINNPVVLDPAHVRSDKQDYTLPSYQASAYVKPSANSTLYFTYDRSTAVNTGVFGSFLTWGANNKLNPLAFESISELYEAGVKLDLIPGKLFTSASGFVQYRDTTPDTNGNIAKVRIKGIESSLRYQPSETLGAGLNVTYLDAINTYIIPGGFSPFGFFADNATVFGDNNRLIGRTGGRYGVPGVPKYSVNGFVDYHLANGLGAELSAWYTSKFYTNLSRSVVVPDGYQANLTVYYRHPRFDLSVTVVNLTDQENFLNALTGGEFLQPLPPRSVQAQFAVRF
ncbi:hypothetical protein FHS96_005250 [Sphingomonas zeicaulis]|uniref:TonB-dependent receptor n=1 Tax=Sphingomonas zeicaulis TaxID=1632740 RepID=UPI003D1D097F